MSVRITIRVDTAHRKLSFLFTMKIYNFSQTGKNIKSDGRKQTVRLNQT